MIDVYDSWNKKEFGKVVWGVIVKELIYQAQLGLFPITDQEPVMD